ncbi:superoxide dismutase family protein [Arsenicitalea aurantiaca]|uniref:Superoxide dismutase family protein n=1 Tax=Arsenicitalea aurantiaca TaxID=1783274 RepID=A0A433XLY1_9HYPH|nr:superoxide dismutase family protein [Arsenicitalea aurantiaca]RUT35095.1 superoxide dismutase family protein [Arsenicitalea aurantiaca]
MTKKLLATAALCTLLTAPALAQESPQAVATFLNIEGQTIGTVELTEDENGVRIFGDVTGLPGGGTHGFHIHETGDCDPTTDFESAGDHFNPGGEAHGFEHAEGHHAGDIENQIASADGTIEIDVTVDSVTLGEGETSVFDEDGSALVLHADADDYISQPAGASGDRIACAVIEAAPTE